MRRCYFAPRDKKTKVGASDCTENGIGHARCAFMYGNVVCLRVFVADELLVQVFRIEKGLFTVYTELTSYNSFSTNL